MPSGTGWWQRTTPAAAPARCAAPASDNLCEGVKRPGYKLYGHTAPGALAEYAVRPPVVLHRIPPEISDVEAALINQGAMTVHALRRVQFRAGSTVAVFGPGPAGHADRGGGQSLRGDRR